MKLKPIDEVIMNICRCEGIVTPKNLMKRYDLSYNTVKKHLNRLEDDGVIIRTHPRNLTFKLN